MRMGSHRGSSWGAPGTRTADRVKCPACGWKTQRIARWHEQSHTLSYGHCPKCTGGCTCKFCREQSRYPVPLVPLPTPYVRRTQKSKQETRQP